jgi:hypothetical protein
MGYVPFLIWHHPDRKTIPHFLLPSKLGSRMLPFVSRLSWVELAKAVPVPRIGWRSKGMFVLWQKVKYRFSSLIEVFQSYVLTVALYQGSCSNCIRHRCDCWSGAEVRCRLHRSAWSGCRNQPGANDRGASTRRSLSPAFSIRSCRLLNLTCLHDLITSVGARWKSNRSSSRLDRSMSSFKALQELFPCPCGTLLLSCTQLHELRSSFVISLPPGYGPLRPTLWGDRQHDQN